MVSKSVLVMDAFDAIGKSHPEYSDRWMTAFNWVKIIPKHCKHHIEVNIRLFGLGFSDRYKRFPVTSYNSTVGPNEANISKAQRNNVTVYCSMTMSKLPTKNHSQIDYSAAQSFDISQQSTPETRNNKRSVEEKIILPRRIGTNLKKVCRRSTISSTRYSSNEDISNDIGHICNNR